MSAPRACLPCREAKTKCDQIRPSCGRCVSKAIPCHGYPPQVSNFRDENEAAQKNSQRARQGHKKPLVIGTVELEPVERPQQEAPTNPDDNTSLEPFQWSANLALVDPSQTLFKDVSARAVDRFFVDWILDRDDDGLSLGYMHDLPRLFSKSRSGSVIRASVQAIAYADVRNASDEDGISFQTKAQRNYGRALNHVRELLNDGEALVSDDTLVAILLIDCFELMYLARSGSPGPHSSIIKHLLRTRGETHVEDRSQLGLWHAANQRLQIQQVQYREAPDHNQMGSSSELDYSHSDVRAAADIEHMIALCANVRALVQAVSKQKGRANYLADKAKTLADEMGRLMSSFESGTDPKAVEQEQHAESSSQPDFDSSDTTNMASHRLTTSSQSVWKSCMHGIHAASHVVLKESFIQLLNCIATLEHDGPSEEDTVSIQQQNSNVEKLVGNVMESCFLLLVIPEAETVAGQGVQQGRMVARFFVLRMVQIVQTVQCASEQHRKAAADILKSLTVAHGLGTMSLDSNLETSWNTNEGIERVHE